MNIYEEAIIYATIMHQGKTRRISNVPYILHPLEVAHIISNITEDIEVITAGVLHDIVEDTDGTINEIEARFGKRVAALVASETENRHSDEDPVNSWKRRKEESLFKLSNSKDMGVKILWLGDKLSNIRSLAGAFSEKGEAIWQSFHQTDPMMHKWYYKTIAEYLEADLNRTGAYKEFIQKINFLWPGTFASEKTKYKKYKEYSLEGCQLIGRGNKGDVYRYNDELIIKVYNENNTFKDIENEEKLAKAAFFAGIPTAISYGIVLVGKKYASVYELIDSSDVSGLIANNPTSVNYYADMMAELAKRIHKINGENVGVPDLYIDMYNMVNNGLNKVDEATARQVIKLIDELPRVKTLVHGDFHTGNVIVQRNEPVLIDMDWLSINHPIIEISGIYLFYVAFGELDKSVVENFMHFSYDIAKQFYLEFMKCYLETDDMNRIKEVEDKAAILAYVRLIARLYKKGDALSDKSRQERDYYVERIKEKLKTVTSLEF